MCSQLSTEKDPELARLKEAHRVALQKYGQDSREEIQASNALVMYMTSGNNNVGFGTININIKKK